MCTQKKACMITNNKDNIHLLSIKIFKHFHTILKSKIDLAPIFKKKTPDFSFLSRKAK